MWNYHWSICLFGGLDNLYCKTKPLYHSISIRQASSTTLELDGSLIHIVSNLKGLTKWGQRSELGATNNYLTPTFGNMNCHSWFNIPSCYTHYRNLQIVSQGLTKESTTFFDQFPKRLLSHQGNEGHKQSIVSKLAQESGGSNTPKKPPNFY